MPMMPMTNSGFESIFFLVFFLILGGFIFSVVRSIAEWANNQSSPVQIRAARIVAKRTSVWGGGGEHHHTSTSYYATFQFADDGNRMELQLPAKAFGLLAEGDEGKLNYQGTQFNGFER